MVKIMQRKRLVVVYLEISVLKKRDHWNSRANHHHGHCFVRYGSIDMYLLFRFNIRLFRWSDKFAMPYCIIYKYCAHWIAFIDIVTACWRHVLKSVFSCSCSCSRFSLFSMFGLSFFCPPKFAWFVLQLDFYYFIGDTAWTLWCRHYTIVIHTRRSHRFVFRQFEFLFHSRKHFDTWERWNKRICA